MTVSTHPSVVPRTSPRWHLMLWVVQILLAALFGLSGAMKLFIAPADLARIGLGYAAEIPHALLLFIGVSELAGAVGLILPAAMRIMPFLTPLAALGFALIQVLALLFHYQRGELAEMAPMNLTFLVLALLVAWGRFRRVPITARHSTAAESPVT